MKRYKLRAEIIHDIVDMLTFFSPKIVRYKVYSLEQGLPDVVMEFDTELDLDTLISYLKNLPDSHVMYETLKAIDDYTGEREELKK